MTMMNRKSPEQQESDAARLSANRRNMESLSRHRKLVHDDLEELKQAAQRQTVVEEESLAPDFERNLDHLNKVWLEQGEPALRELNAAWREVGPEFEAAAKLDFATLAASGISRARLDPLEQTVDSARAFYASAKNQLEEIPGKIRRLTLADEAAYKINCKQSDYILTEMRWVLGAADHIRELHQTLRFRLGRVAEALRRANPAPGQVDGVTNNVN
jgi:hypothetical protein